MSRTLHARMQQLSNTSFNMASKLQGIGFVRRLWSDKPEIAGSLCLCAVGIIGQVIFALRYDKDLNHQHRWKYTANQVHEKLDLSDEDEIDKDLESSDKKMLILRVSRKESTIDFRVFRI